MYDGTITVVAHPHLPPEVSNWMTDYLVKEQRTKNEWSVSAPVRYPSAGYLSSCPQ